MGNTQLESVEYELVWALVKNPHWFRHALNVCLAIVSPFVGLACAFISTWGCTHTHTHGYIKHRESQITQRYIFSFNPDQLQASCQVCSPSAHKISRQHTTMQASTLLRKPAHYYAIQHTTTQDSTLLRDPAHYNARQHTTTQASTLLRKTALYYASQALLCTLLFMSWQCKKQSSETLTLFWVLHLSLPQTPQPSLTLLLAKPEHTGDGQLGHVLRILCPDRGG